MYLVCETAFDGSASIISFATKTPDTLTQNFVGLSVIQSRLTEIIPRVHVGLITVGGDRCVVNATKSRCCSEDIPCGLLSLLEQHLSLPGTITWLFFIFVRHTELFLSTYPSNR